MRHLAFLTVALFAVACSSEPPVPSEPQPDAVLSAGPFTIEPGEDRTICSYVRADNEQPVDVQAFVTEQARGGHHVIVYTVDHPIDLPPSVCTQGGQPGWDTLLVSQKASERIDFPEGVGFTIGARQQFVIETHFINSSADPIDVSSSVGMVYAAPGSVKERAATYYFGTMNIDIPPNAAATSSGACAPPVPMTVRSMLGHQHRTGTSLDVKLLPGGGGPAEDLYLSTEWEDAPLVTFADGLELGVDDRLQVTCDWENTGGERLRYPREMCFAIGYHWPADTGFTCVSGGGSDACTCFARGNLDVGSGGAKAEVHVRRAAAVPGAGGALDAGDALYCFLYLPDDIGPAGPKPGARPRYFRDAQGAVLASDQDVAPIAFDDVTPGTYIATCMMDTIGGGFVPGSGDVVNSAPAVVVVDTASLATVDVTLDFALP